LTIVAGAATDQKTVIMGMHLPIYQPPTEAGKLTLQVIRQAVAGVDTEKLSIAEHSYDEVIQEQYLHIVEMPGTTAATTGFGNRTELPQPGNLAGILFYSTTIPTATSNVATIQAVRLEVGKERVIERNWQELKADGDVLKNAALFGSPGDASITDNYAFLDLKQAPIAKEEEVVVDINGGVANETYRIIPVYMVSP